MPRGRPKKIKAEVAGTDIAGESFSEVVTNVEPYENETNCFHCGRTLNEVKLAKGDRNQYKFCSIECYNKDITI